MAFFQAAGTSILDQAICAPVNGVVVHLNNFVALLAVGSLCRGFHVIRSLIGGDDVGQLEECGLQNSIDSAAQTDLTADFDTVNGIELDVMIRNILLSLSGSLFSISSISQPQLSRKVPPSTRSSTMSYLPT